jgi:hypothetical protein
MRSLVAETGMVLATALIWLASWCRVSWTIASALARLALATRRRAVIAKFAPGG